MDILCQRNTEDLTLQGGEHLNIWATWPSIAFTVSADAASRWSDMEVRVLDSMVKQLVVLYTHAWLCKKYCY
jgi:hypothetical protein